MRRIAAIGVVLADAGAVAALWPDAPAVAATLARPRAALAIRGADGALAPVLGALVWLAAVWLALGLGAASAARLPGVAGRAGRLLAGRLLPRAVLSLVSGSAGVGLLLAPVAAAAPTPSPSPAWPVTSTSAPAWPTTGTPAMPPKTGRPHDAHAPARTGGDPVTVRRGDSLWTIARTRLGTTATPARIAREWPRWFAANRSVIGADPDLLHPGQVLRPPAGPPSSTSFSPEARP